MTQDHVDADLVVADDSATARELLLLLAQQNGIRAVGADNGEAAMKLVGPRTKAVLLDLHMPHWDGFKCLQYLTDHHPNIPAIVLSSADRASDAVKALKLGAIDYLTKPFDPEELFAIVFKAFEHYRLRQENEKLRDSLGETIGENIIVAESPEMSALMNKARKIASLDSSVLLTGESGVGKGVFARMLHSLSARATKPFVTVSCPALPRDLLESELFGHEKGAFTGAIKRRIGKIESAAGGTLFLDEIGDLPLDLQPKLLNVLQDLQFQRVGGEATIRADVRIIAATNVDFETKIREGSFREDLYYRLSVIPLEIPPLRDRADEIDPLMMKILSDISKRRKCHLIQVTDAVRDVFKAYHWPGNVREMENILERCSAFCEQGVIKIGDLPKELKKTGPTTTLATVDGLGGVSLEELERQALMQTLQLCQGNKADAARRLGISEKSVYNKIKYYGINGA